MIKVLLLQLVSIVLLLLLQVIVSASGQLLINVDDANPNLVITDMNHNNITISVSIPYDVSATSAAIDICTTMESINEGKRFDDFYGCVDDTGRKVLYGRTITNHSHNIIYQDSNKIIINNSIDVDIDNSGISLINKRNEQAKGVPIAALNNVMCTSKHIDINQEILQTELHKTNPTRPSSYNGIGAIVILAQAGQHSTYSGFNALNELKKTLNLLYKNYNNDHKDDVWLFHEGDFTKDIQNDVRQNRSEIRFFHLKDENWSVYPKWLDNRKSSRTRLEYSVGYRLMIRWYAIRIYHVMAMMGYTWVLRLDDDSGILSPIKFNIFGFMEKYNYQYAYRIVAVESPHSLFYDFLISHIIKHNISDISQMMDVCERKETLAGN